MRNNDGYTGQVSDLGAHHPHHGAGQGRIGGHEGDDRRIKDRDD